MFKKHRVPDYFWDFDIAITEVRVYIDDWKIKEAPIRIFKIDKKFSDENGTVMAIIDAESFIDDLRAGREILKNWL